MDPEAMKAHGHAYAPCVKHRDPPCGLLRCMYCGKPKPPNPFPK